MLSKSVSSFWLQQRRWWLLAAVLGVSLLSGCASVTPRDYRGQQPTLDLKQYFNGRLTAVGIVFDRSGKMTRRFHVTIDASWKGDVGTLDEHFIYNDGAKQERIWTIRALPEKDGEKRYIGTAGDVIGEATGLADGNALNWHYTLALQVGGTIYNVQLDDWMYLMDKHVLLNHSVITKFGFKVGSVFLSFNKP
ncbi:MAG: DUF3833 domain-containing protein [Thiomonas sp.]